MIHQYICAGVVYCLQVTVGVHAHTVTLGTVPPATAHLFFRPAPCLKTGWKKSKKSLGVSAVNEVDEEKDY